MTTVNPSFLPPVKYSLTFLKSFVDILITSSKTINFSCSESPTKSLNDGSSSILLMSFNSGIFFCNSFNKGSSVDTGVNIIISKY